MSTSSRILLLVGPWSRQTTVKTWTTRRLNRNLTVEKIFPVFIFYIHFLFSLSYFHWDSIWPSKGLPNNSQESLRKDSIVRKDPEHLSFFSFTSKTSRISIELRELIKNPNPLWEVRKNPEIIKKNYNSKRKDNKGKDQREDERKIAAGKTGVQPLIDSWLKRSWT